MMRKGTLLLLAALVSAAPALAEDKSAALTRSVQIGLAREQKSSLRERAFEQAEEWYEDEKLTQVHNELELSVLDEDQRERLAKRQVIRDTTRSVSRAVANSELREVYKSIRKTFTKVQDKLTVSAGRPEKTADGKTKHPLQARLEPDIHSGAILRLKASDDFSARIDPLGQEVIIQYSTGF